MWSLVPEQSEGNNQTSKINVFPVSHAIIFLLVGHKVDFIASYDKRVKLMFYRLTRNSFYDSRS